jgi:hypothetical protein
MGCDVSVQTIVSRLEVGQSVGVNLEHSPASSQLALLVEAIGEHL